MTSTPSFLLTQLRNSGYRITPQRELIVKAVSDTPTHFTAEMISQQVQEHTSAVNIATIYRTLDLLVEEGLISRSDFGQGQILFASEEHGPHLHLVCRSCGGVIDADIKHTRALEVSLQDDHHFKLDLNHITLFGLCAACKKGDSTHAV